GDLPYHLRVINRFALGNEFPPDNPIFNGASFTYPFITDLVASMFVVTGATARQAMLLQNLILIFSVVALMWRFTFCLTKSTAAANLAPFLLLFNGGLGFLLFFGDAVSGEQGVLLQTLHLTTDYTIRGGTIWRWGDTLTSLFITQRTLLLGLSIALIVLT